ncbi:MAG: HDOD domain-containing protein [Verrucomicrobia bacterium]|nr:HDOD domain-containing protein [Verrucomicrobiota bacterium]
MPQMRTIESKTTRPVLRPTTSRNMTMTLIDLDAFIKKADELQPLPASTTKLVSVASGTETNVDEITKVISFDPALTMRLLRTDNSAFSGTALTITTVHEAVSRLGTARVLSLAIASHTKPMMRVQLRPYGLSEGALWRHSVIAMLAAESIARVTRVPIPPAASTAALLHDIGKLVMACFISPEILDLIEQGKKIGNLTPLEAEAQILQVHHGELGGLIARHWQLPEAIAKGLLIITIRKTATISFAMSFTWRTSPPNKSKPNSNNAKASSPSLKAWLIDWGWPPTLWRNCAPLRWVSSKRSAPFTVLLKRISIRALYRGRPSTGTQRSRCRSAGRFDVFLNSEARR